jgi:predicted transcriptional regulator
VERQLLHTRKSQAEIAREFGISKQAVSAINMQTGARPPVKRAARQKLSPREWREAVEGLKALGLYEGCIKTIIEKQGHNPRRLLETAGEFLKRGQPVIRELLATRSREHIIEILESRPARPPNVRVKLPPAKALEVARLLEETTLRQAQIAKRAGVSPSVVSAVNKKLDIRPRRQKGTPEEREAAIAGLKSLGVYRGGIRRAVEERGMSPVTLLRKVELFAKHGLHVPVKLVLGKSEGWLAQHIREKRLVSSQRSRAKRLPLQSLYNELCSDIRRRTSELGGARVQRIINSLDTALSMLRPEEKYTLLKAARRMDALQAWHTFGRLGNSGITPKERERLISSLEKRGEINPKG